MKEETKARIGGIIENAIDKGETAGAEVLFLRDGRETFYGSYGAADLESGAPIRRDTIMRMFSMTKPVTAVAAMILFERGLLDFGTPVKQLIPGFGDDYLLIDGKKCRCGKEMTVHHLLNMTSGLTYGGIQNEAEKRTTRLVLDCERRAKEGSEVSTVEFARLLSELPRAFEPDSSWQYGFSADVLGAVIECVSGMRFGDFLEQELFAPLGMRDTGFFVPKEKAERVCRAYISSGSGELRQFSGDNLLVAFPTEKRPAFESGGAGLVSTMDDYAKFVRMLLNGGENDGVRVLREETLRFLRSGSLTAGQQAAMRRAISMEGFTYTHLMRRMARPEDSVGLGRADEFGWDSWMCSYFACFPHERMAMILMQQKPGEGTEPLTRKIRNVWLLDEA